MIRPMLADDVFRIDVQPRHRWTLTAIQAQPLTVAEAVASPWSFTHDDGVVNYVCGISATGGAWALLADGLGGAKLRSAMRHGQATMRAYRRQHEQPVFATIDPGHPEAVRWARLGGMTQVSGDRWEFEP